MKTLQLGNEKKLVIRTNHGARFVSADQIVYVTAHENYSRIMLLNLEVLMVSDTLKSIESQLQTNDFFRCHKSYLVNLNFCFELVCNEDDKLKLSIGEDVPVSRNGMRRLKELLEL